jgi:hypothetical protein
MHAYLGGIARRLSGVALAVGGVEDHVHLLIGLRATHRLSDFMRELKTNSSEWAHVIFPGAAPAACHWLPSVCSCRSILDCML